MCTYVNLTKKKHNRVRAWVLSLRPPMAYSFKNIFYSCAHSFDKNTKPPDFVWKPSLDTLCKMQGLFKRINMQYHICKNFGHPPESVWSAHMQSGLTDAWSMHETFSFALCPLSCKVALNSLNTEASLNMCPFFPAIHTKLSKYTVSFAGGGI